MRKEFLLTPSAIATIAEFTLSFIILIYLLSLKDKSKNAWFYIVTLIISTIYFAVAVINNTMYSHLTGQLHNNWLAFTLLSQMWFAYKLGGNPFKHEMYIALIVTATIFFITFYRDSSGFLSFPVNLAGHFWIGLVFLRKAEWISNKESDKAVQENKDFHNSLRGVL